MATVAAVNELGSYAHNPRGNLWFNDESSYGQKLLSKMGWSKGKGLGKKEDGIKESLKVKFKNTNSGLGYKDESYTNVMKTEYESILKSLSAEYPQKKKNGCNKGVEHENKDFKQKSKIVKNKIRYPKLYYGKDVSKYSEEDMKCIFICSLPSKDNEEEKSKDSRLGFKKEPENQMPKEQETYTSHTSHLSISDYFNLKMKEKKDNEQMKKFSSKIKQEDSDSDCPKTNDVVKQGKTTYECNRTDYKLAQKKFALENNRKDYKIKGKKCNSDCNERDYNLAQEKIYFQSHITENAVTRPSKKRFKTKKKLNTEANINGNDDELLSFEREDRKDVITPNKERKHLSEHSAYGEDLSEDKMSGRSDFMDHQLSVPSKKRKKSRKKENLCTLSSNAALSSFQSDIHPDIVPNKKRKKSHRNADGASVGAVELLSVVSQKDEESANSGLVRDISPSGSIEIIDKSIPDINNNCTKKKKKLKNKLKSLNKLKSCLKSKSKEYAVKNVSFNENVSYQIIDSDNESIVSISDCEDKLQNDLKLSTTDSDSEHENHLSDDTLEIQRSRLSEQNGTNNSDALKTAAEEEAKECESSSSLPSPSSSHYNSWVESQKLALKMKLYKNILNGIKNHDILKTTNLLSIKGYGSWGF